MLTDRDWEIMQGDSLTLLRQMPDQCVQTVITSPPYWSLRNYQCDGQIGLESNLDDYVSCLVEVFHEMRRVLRDDGCFWLVIGDAYAGSGGAHTQDHANPGLSRSAYRDGVPKYKQDGGRGAVKLGLPAKNLFGIPWRLAFALQQDGWYWRQWCPWIKRNCLPDSAPDRPASACEVVLFLSKGPRSYYDHEAVRIPRVTHDGRPDSITRDKVFGYDSKLAEVRGRKQDEVGNRRYTGFNERWKQKYSFARKVNENPPPGQPNQHREDREEKLYDDGRYRRNSDWFFKSWQGMVTDEEGWPLAFVVNTKGLKEKHYAAFPEKLVEPMILATSQPGDMVLDPFSGAGTTVMVALRHGRKGLGLELNSEYVEMSKRRIVADNPLINGYAEGVW